MESKQLYAIIAVVIIIVAAAGAVIAFSGDDGEYRSTNTDGRLAILGNADENDYLDEDDVKAIEQMIKDGKYSQMADANNDSKVDQKDVDFVKNLLEIKKFNEGKDFSEKKSAEVNYIGVDKDVLTGKYPVNKIAISCTQRSLGLAIAIGAGDNIAALNDYVFQYWDENLFKNYKGLPSIGDRKTPDLETILGMDDVDTIYAGSVTKYSTNIPDNKIGDKQVLRMVSYEDGRLAEGALMLGFFTDHDKGAQKYVKWMDDIVNEIDKKMADVADPSATRFYLGTPTYMYAQTDGVSTAFTNSGATNVGNIIVTSKTAAGMSVSKCLEDILRENPGYIIAGKYMYTQNSADDVKAVFDGLDFSNFAATDGYKNGNIYMVNYDLPFCIHTYIACSIFFPEQFPISDLEDMIQGYLDEFCEAEGYDFQLYHFLVTPETF